jgi:hypothetical protein
MARAGIATAYFEGNEADTPPPEDRLRGVRLAVLDMDIVGARVDEKSRVAALLGFLEKVLSPANGPYIAIVWTKHKELRELFEAAVVRSEQLPRPILVTMIEKAQFAKGDGRFDLEALSSRLNDELRSASPLVLCQAWEGTASAAASDVINQLSALAAPAAATLPEYHAGWKANMLCLLHTIARASAEQHLGPATCIDAISAALNPLNTDRMEQMSGALSNGLDWIAAEVLGAPPDCGDERRARVNGMLHVGLPRANILVPGGIYVGTEELVRRLGVNVATVFDDLVKPSGNAAQRQEWINEIKAGSRFILVEFSAACDHAQKNIRSARCVAGLLVPRGSHGRIKDRGQFFWSFGPIFLGAGAGGIAPGDYHVVLSARHPSSFESGAAADLSAMGLTGIGRLRAQALSALQAWINAQAARPGLLFLQP